MTSSVEPWLRGTHADLGVVQRAVVHALELAGEDLERWCGPLTTAQMYRDFGDLPSVGYHLLHIAGSIDRLLTYAEGNMLSEQQLTALREEHQPRGTTQDILRETRHVLEEAIGRVQVFAVQQLEEGHVVGRKQLPATVGGLLIHVAEHTQRHVGQAIVTAKLARK